jgi:hypothetical protein
MKIREGAYYRTRDGYVVGPMKINLDDPDRPWCDQTGMAWPDDGKYDDDLDLKTDINGDSLDLISEVYVSDTPPGLTATTITNQSYAMPEAKTLRDDFAMAALPVAYQSFNDVRVHGGLVFNAADVAERAYQFADAMLEARKK